jgi:mevalonate kinase
MPIAKAISDEFLHQPPDFSCISTGKCIVAGEHAVLRGAPALVVPVVSRFLQLDYWNTSSGLQIQIEGEQVIPSKLRLNAFVDYARAYLRVTAEQLQGSFYFRFHIPVACGLGTSACISVAFARWCLWRGLISESHLFETAHAFENFFHGVSSGVDVAAVLYGKPLLYQKDKGFEVLEPTWLPMLFLSATGKVSKTAEAIAKVLKSTALLPCKGLSYDLEMAESTRLVCRSLLSVPHKGFVLLKEAMDKANRCFQAWGLSQSKIVKKHFRILQELGAVAVKQTGAGDGGYMLSLWEKPPSNPPFEMIRVF